jgi:hypothetical protein
MEVWFYSRIETTALRPTPALKPGKEFTPALLPSAPGGLLPLDTDLSWKSAISNEVGRCKSYFVGCWPPQGTLIRSLVKALIVALVCSPLTLGSVSLHRFGAAHQPSLRSLRTMMTNANSLPAKGGGWPNQPDGDDSHHSRLQASPHRQHCFASVRDDRILRNRSDRAA